ncbi:glycoside hydrolase family 3 protein [Actinoplanes sp. TFC3]|uniref:glycoside hydrolase family 3 protein n=1 Tax=Actinoplanes sp. TFC3 TaxID=1710355 RepID=UPI00082AC1AE|nr:glycoside hydrolase family 3 N-terminal domain-containing protein [Actinoplanes sp. TFC3]
MTIDPALRRLALGTLLAAFPGPTVPPWVVALLTEGLAGITLFRSNLADQDLIKTLHTVRSQLLLATDEEGGDVSRLGSPFPGNAALGAVDDPDLTHSVHRAIGAQLRRAGINLTFAPVVDVNTTAENPIIGTRAFGASPALVSRHAAAAVTGLQSAGVAACAKHFPGHGATVTDSHLALPTVEASRDLLRARDLPPFAAAIAAGTAAIMTAHIRIPGLTGSLPATFSGQVLQGLLREEYGFNGAIVTDALEMRGAVSAAGSVGRAAVLALGAGADVLCLGARVSAEVVEDVVAEIVAAVRDGRLSGDRVAGAADRAARLAFAFPMAAAASPASSASAAGAAVELGLSAARRALRVEGPVDGFAGALVVRVHSGSTIAEGSTPWGAFPGAITIAAATSSAEDLITQAGSRPIVLAGRRLHRDPDIRNLIESLATRHTVAVVEMGWPSSWRPAGVQAYLTTFGAAAANTQAAAHALGLTHHPS